MNILPAVLQADPGATLLTLILIGIFGLVATGLYGLLVCRSLIRLLIALQILVKAAMLALIAAGEAAGQINVGQSLAVTVMVVDTIVAIIGLALGIQARRLFGTYDVRAFSSLRG